MGENWIESSWSGLTLEEKLAWLTNNVYWLKLNMDVNDSKFIKMYNELKSNFEDFSLYVNNNINDIKTDVNDVNNTVNDIKTDINDVNNTVNDIKTDINDVNNTVNDIKTDINDVNNKKNDKLLIYNYELHPGGVAHPPVKNNKFYMISIEFSFHQPNGIKYYDSAIISNTVGDKKLFCIFEKGLIDDATYKYEVILLHGKDTFSMLFNTYRLNEDTGVWDKIKYDNEDDEIQNTANCTVVDLQLIKEVI